MKTLVLILALAAAPLAASADTASLALTIQVDHRVNLAWLASASTDVVGYFVYRGTVSGGPYTKISPQVAGLAFTDPAAKPLATYYYVVTALDQNNVESVFSNEAAAVVGA